MLYKRATSWLVTAAMLLIGVTALASDTKLGSKISSVTVFNDRALITRTVEVDLTVGSHSLTIPDIPLIADEQSLRASATGGNLVIHGLKHKIVSVPSDSTRMKTVSSLLDTLYIHWSSLNDRKSVLEMQKSMLDQLIANAGKTLSDDMTKVAFDAKNWEQAYTFISRNLSFVVDSLRAIGLEFAGISKRCSVLESELAKLKSNAMQQTRHVTIDVEVESADRSQISIAYLVPQASWSPIYNARLIDSGRVELSYFGQVSQNTGEDWKDVKLTLSTAIPNRVTSPGNLAQRILSVCDPRSRLLSGTSLRGGRMGEIIYEIDGAQITDPIGGNGIEDLSIITSDFDAEYGNAGAPYVSAMQTSTTYSTSFAISRLETIKSGDQFARTQIAQWVIYGNETLIARPQNYQNVFRFMKMKNTTGAPLLPGTINLFAQNDYVGQFESPDLILPGEEFEMPFGIDDGIEIKREISNRLNSIDGDKCSLSETINITLFNKSGVDRTVDLEEALITSNDSRVKVDIKSVVPKPNETDFENKAKWQVKLATSSKEVVSISYKIEYPRMIQLSGL